MQMPSLLHLSLVGCPNVSGLFQIGFFCVLVNQFPKTRCVLSVRVSLDSFGEPAVIVALSSVSRFFVGIAVDRLLLETIEHVGGFQEHELESGLFEKRKQPTRARD